MKFTERSIKALKPEEKRRDIREGESRPGFAIRVSPRGKKTFIFIYTLNGVKHRLTLGVFGDHPAMSLSEAHSKYEVARRKVEKGIDPAAEKLEAELAEKEADTVNQLAAEYLEKWAKPRKRSWEEDQRILEKDILPTIGNKKAKDVTRRDVIHLLDKIAARGAPIAANRTLALLSKMFHFAIGRDIVPFSPCFGIAKVAPEHQKDRVLSDDEIRQHWYGILASEMTEQTKVVLLLQLVTAQRKGEVVAMRWDQIDNEKVWTIPAELAKNGEAHRVPLSPQALALLERIKNSSPWVFTAPSGHPRGDSRIGQPKFGSGLPSGHLRGDSVSRATRRYLMRIEKSTESGQKTKLTKDDQEWFTPHDFRRTAATNMTKLGYNRLTVSKVLNHAESGVTAVYDRHSYDKEKRQALEAWGRHLDVILAEKQVERSNVINLRF